MINYFPFYTQEFEEWWAINGIQPLSNSSSDVLVTAMKDITYKAYLQGMKQGVKIFT